MEPAAFTPESPALVLAPTDQAPGQARRFLVERFQELGIAETYVGRIVVTELVTNSYKHVGFGHIVVRVLPDVRDGLVRIEVWDQGAGTPEVRPENHDATSGRGLLMLAQLVQDWGVRPLVEEGKVVWAAYAP
ncbi:ATP-binding protein [Actinomadura nitritigenes]|uniref:ATP-binding protein n=1 Tax=Actinomadura nitritigenes TaxID=134602 RepID=UPI0034920E8B